MDFLINENIKSLCFDERPKNKKIEYIILHYTERDFNTSLDILTKKLSSHYLIPEFENNSNNIYKNDKIYKLLSHNKRAWHAGKSSWKGHNDLNDVSLGIEIVNIPKIHDDFKNCVFFNYQEKQIEILIDLIKKIILKEKNIKKENILGHSDISPGRKIDPGPKFPWKKLYENGIGTWYNEKHVLNNLMNKNFVPDIRTFQSMLKLFGYNIEKTGKFDKFTENITRAFQMRFRQNNYSGKIDMETFLILESLLTKYS